MGGGGYSEFCLLHRLGLFCIGLNFTSFFWGGGGGGVGGGVVGGGWEGECGGVSGFYFWV